ncbi:MAG: response regulator transcription factor [Paludibacteraceae bacterium]|nr:response regulator transcription factor [Paludibacteraceae bacterium]
MATFILADNQDLTRYGFVYIIDHFFPNHSIVRTEDRIELEDELKKADESIVLVDPELFDIDTLEDLEVLASRYIHSQWILVSNDFDDTTIRNMSARQEVSILLKESGKEEIRSAIKCALKQDRFICHQITNRLLSMQISSDSELLTPTEVEVLRLIAQGKSVKEIASIRFSSSHTIVSHKKNIFRKIGVNSVHEATRYALKSGLVDIDYYI